MAPTPADPSAAVPAADDEDALARSRRATPKERPGRRRGTQVERHEIREALPEGDLIESASGYLRGEASGKQLLGQSASPQEPSGPASAARASEESVSSRASSAPLVQQTNQPSIVVDPELGAEQKAEPAARRSLAADAGGSDYEPLPSDREGYEAFMRARAEGAARSGSRSEWIEQETALISRGQLRARRRGVSAEPRPGARSLLVLLLGLAALGGGIAWLRANSGQQPIEIDDAPAAATAPAAASAKALIPAGVETTLIASEPAGAEIVLGGAVLGNTPAEVVRPTDEELYLLRLAGFEPQLVRLSASSRDAIRITLTPLGSAPVLPRPALPPSAAAPAPTGH